MVSFGKTRNGRADMTNFEMDLFDTRITNPMDKDVDDDEDCCKHSIIKPACLPITILLFLLMMTFFIPLFNDELETLRRYERTGVCTDKCRLEIVESIPTDLVFPGQRTYTPTYDAWSDLLDNARKSIDMAVFYWNLRDRTGHFPTARPGNETFNRIVAAAHRGVTIRVAQNDDGSANDGGAYLASHRLAEVRRVNFSRLFGSGVLHTKMWIIDERHVYIGSANMDWKSLTEVKELGVVIRNCSCIANDLGKIFQVYWRIGEPGAKIPLRWPVHLRTNFNFQRPLQIKYNGRNALSFLSSAPPDLNPKGREYDLNAIVRIMREASTTIRIAVMDYFPITMYMPGDMNRYFGDIDDAIREAAFRGVEVRMLISHWAYTRAYMDAYLRSLLQINSATRGRIRIKTFEVPADKQQNKIPYTRVNHNKYMVTDDTVYIGTSNWAGDYFISTAGVGFVLKATTPTQQNATSQALVDEFKSIFDRDYESQYARLLELTQPSYIKTTVGPSIE